MNLHGMKNYLESSVVGGKKFDLERIWFIKFERAYCFYGLHDPLVFLEMHSFSDASNRMDAAVIYLCFEMKSGISKSLLVCIKNQPWFVFVLVCK